MTEQTLHNHRPSQNDDFADQTLAMIQAAEKGNLSQIALLLERDPTLATAYNPRPHDQGGGGTVLHHAAWAGQKEAVELLLDYGADINLKAHHGTPIGWANEGGQKDMVDFLIQKGAGINFIQAAAYGRIDIMQESIKENPDILYSKAHQHPTALHAAAYWGQDKAAKLLIKKGMDVNIKSPNKSTPLHTASSTLQLPLITLLLDHKAEINSSDHNGETPLHKAVKNGYIPNHIATKDDRQKVVTYLIHQGADLNAQNHHGHTACHVAKQSGFDDIHPLLQPQANKS